MRTKLDIYVFISNQISKVKQAKHDRGTRKLYLGQWQYIGKTIYSRYNLSAQIERVQDQIS
jgi:hypothetical protein